jgi:L-rhamnose mutarotase
MARQAFTARIRPDKVDAYVEAHAHVWPEMRAMISASGVRNYSIYVAGTRIFGYFECDDPDAVRAYQAAQDVTKRWGEAMSQLFEPEVATEGIAFLPEIFRLD